MTEPHFVRISRLPLEEQLEQWEALAQSYDTNVPMQLSYQIETYSEMLRVIAKLVAAAKHDFGFAYANRKLIHGISLAETKGTQADKNGQAEQDAYPNRLKEAELEAVYEKWKYLFEATQELIQAKKKTLELLRDELNKGSGRGN